MRVSNRIKGCESEKCDMQVEVHIQVCERVSRCVRAECSCAFVAFIRSGVCFLSYLISMGKRKTIF